MASSTPREIYFLKNDQGQAVRAVEWQTNELDFVLRPRHPPYGSVQ